MGSNQSYTNTTIRLIPPLDEPVTVYFSTTGTVQYLTFSNNSVNISSEDEEVSYAVNGSVGYPPGGTTTIGAMPNNSSGGKNVGQTTMTLLGVSMDTVYAGRDFNIYLWPSNQQGHLTLKTSDGVIYDNDVTGPTVTFIGPYNVSTITSIWTIADGRAADSEPVLQPANYRDVGINGICRSPNNTF